MRCERKRDMPLEFLTTHKLFVTHMKNDCLLIFYLIIVFTNLREILDFSSVSFSSICLIQ
jgi:hypothetical protein